MTDQIAESVAGWNDRWLVPSTGECLQFSECQQCSALVAPWSEARLNHERWHVLNDGSGAGESMEP